MDTIRITVERSPGIVKAAKDEDDLVSGLLEAYPVVLVAGADNAHINVLASEPGVYTRCGLSKP